MLLSICIGWISAFSSGCEDFFFESFDDPGGVEAEFPFAIAAIASALRFTGAMAERARSSFALFFRLKAVSLLLLSLSEEPVKKKGKMLSEKFLAFFFRFTMLASSASIAMAFRSWRSQSESIHVGSLSI